MHRSIPSSFLPLAVLLLLAVQLGLSACAANGAASGASDAVRNMATEPPLAAASRAEFDGTARYRVDSKNVDDVFTIDVWEPVHVPGPFPVVYVLDGNSSFGLVAQTVIPMMFVGEIPAVIVVGIGYEVESPMEVAALRSRDLLPSLEEGYIERVAGTIFDAGPGILPGGADAFLAFIEEEVKPLVAANHAVDSSDETLAGYSFGGTFASHVLFNSTDSFDRYLIGSPVLDWDDGLLFKNEDAYASSERVMRKHLFLSAGEYEVENRIRPGVERMIERLAERDYEGLDWASHIFPEETHGSALGPTMSRGLRAVFGAWPASN